MSQSQIGLTFNNKAQSPDAGKFMLPRSRGLSMAHSLWIVEHYVLLSSSPQNLKSQHPSLQMVLNDLCIRLMSLPCLFSYIIDSSTRSLLFPTLSFFLSREKTKKINQPDSFFPVYYYSIIFQSSRYIYWGLCIYLQEDSPKPKT